MQHEDYLSKCAKARPGIFNQGEVCTVRPGALIQESIYPDFIVQ